MLTLEFTLNVFVFAAILIAAAYVGFTFSKIQISKNRHRIAELENELIRNHSEILSLQKEFIAIELKLNSTKDPVVVMKNVLKQESNEKLPDVSLRKKLLGVDNNSVKEETYPLPYKILLSKEA